MTLEPGRIHLPLKETIKFVYIHSISLVGVSFFWFIGSLPILTLGVSTLGAYSAIISLKTSNSIKKDTILSSLKSYWVNVTLLSWVVVIIALVTMVYFYRYIINGNLWYMTLCILGVYLLIFTTAIGLTSFILIEQNYTFSEAIRNSYLLLIANPLFSVSCLLLCFVIIIIGLISIVGLVIIIPGLLFSFHIVAFEKMQQAMNTPAYPR